MKLLHFKKSAAIAAAIAGVAVAGILGAGPASASQPLPPSSQVTINGDVAYYGAPSVDGYLGQTIPQIKCVAENGSTADCLIQTPGVGGVTLDLTLSPKATFHYDFSNQKFAVWDKAGNFVRYVDIACKRNDGPGGVSLRCENTVDNFKINIPAGGNISPVNDSLRRIDLFSQSAANGETVLTRSLNINGRVIQANDFVVR